MTQNAKTPKAEIKSKLELSLRAIATKDVGDDKISSLADEIILRSKLAGVNELPRAKLCTESKSEKEMEKLAKLSIDLHKHIDTMHKTSLEQFLDQDVIHPLAFQWELEKIIDIAGRAHLIPRSIARTNKGRAKALQATAVTNFLGKIYTDLTKKRAARSVNSASQETGKYLEFVKTVFSLIGIKNKAGSQVSVRSKKLYNKTSKK